MNIMKQYIWIFLATISAVLSGAEADFANVDIDENFYPFLTARKRFMQIPGVKKLTASDGRKIIFCVVSMPSKGMQGAQLANMIKICRKKAQTELLKAEQVEISTITVASEKISSVTDGKTECVKSIEDFLEVTTEKAHGIVKTLPVIGYWYSKDHQEFFLAIGEIRQSASRK